MTDVRNVTPPNLPVAGAEYERRWQDQFSNTLRLFFSQLTNAVNVALSARVGYTLTDGVVIPDKIIGTATIYIDKADGDLKIKFGDGTVKTIVTD